jgi:NADH-quinone oxidoreductase subunit A
LLANYGSIGLFLAVAIFFAVTTLLLPYFLSLPSRFREPSYLSDLVPIPSSVIAMIERMPLPSSIAYLLTGHIPLPSFVIRLFRFSARFSRLVPWKPNPIKDSTYECGMETIGKAWVQFNFRYYFYALVFIALDILVVFLYPWAVELRQLGLFAFIALLIFVFIIIIGYIYAWRKKVLEWK